MEFRPHSRIRSGPRRASQRVSSLNDFFYWSDIHQHTYEGGSIRTRSLTLRTIRRSYVFMGVGNDINYYPSSLIRS